MKEQPILFSTEMVQSILAGRKTQTRRTKGLEKLNKDPDKWFRCHPSIETDAPFTFVSDQYSKEIDVKCPYGNPGDLLWVRETWQKRSQKAINMGFDQFYYKAGWEGCADGGWKPSIHMPKAAARIWLQVESVHIDRLHYISLQDIESEGLPANFRDNYTSPYIWFSSLWDRINGWCSFDINPWVWVIKFKTLSTTGKPILNLEPA